MSATLKSKLDYLDYNYDDEDYDDFEAEFSKRKSGVGSKQSKPISTSQNNKKSSRTGNYSNEFSEPIDNK